MGQVGRPVLEGWATLASCFPPDNRQLIGLLFPRLMLNRSELVQTPTTEDPMGTRPRVQMQHAAISPGEYRVKFTIDGIDTPWLVSTAMMVYLVMEYPRLFSGSP